MADLLGTGISGLLAYRRTLSTIGHNISNVNTEGYSRQRVELDTRPPQFQGGSYVGSGVQVDSVRRIYDEFLATQVRTSTALQQQHETTHDLASQIDNLLGDPDSGLAPTIESFFNGLQDLANDPSSTPTRQVVLSEGRSLAARFNDFFDRLDTLRAGVNTRLDNLVGEVNTLAQSIADVNKDILAAQSGAGNQLPNDLLDQRDRLVTKLSEYVSVRTIDQSDGTASVFIGNGQSLVVGTNTQSLDTTRDPFDPTRLRITYQNTSGVSADLTNQIAGGKLGGVLEFRDDVLDPAINGLGKVALGLTESFNAQHQLGQDLDGDLGGDFFTSGSPEVLAHTSNSGSATVSASIASPTDVADLTTSNYELERDGTDYTLTRLSDGNTFDLDASGFPGSSVQVDGVTIALSSGTIADGDRFLIRPTQKAAEQIGLNVTNTNDIAAAAPIRTRAGTSNSGAAEVSAGTVNQPPPPDANLQQTVTITFNNPPTTFDVSGTGTGNPTGVAYTSGSDITYNGWTVQVTGSPAAGDTFVVETNSGGVGDNRNALLLADIQDLGTLDSGRSSILDAYGDTVSRAGTRTRQAELSNEAQSKLLEQSIAAQQSVSGVNLDEEAADLVRFQQAYQATAQVIGVAQSLFDSLLASVRR